MNIRKHSMVVVLAAVLTFTSIALAHPGRTDSNGGHTNRKTGEYHYHNGGSSGGSAPKATVKPKATARPKATPKPTATPKPSVPIPRAITIPDALLPIESELQFGKTNKDRVILRESNTSSSKSAGIINDAGTAFEIIDSVEGSKQPWYRIWYGEEVVYIYSDHVELISKEGYLSGE